MYKSINKSLAALPCSKCGSLKKLINAVDQVVCAECRTIIKEKTAQTEIVKK